MCRVTFPNAHRKKWIGLYVQLNGKTEMSLLSIKRYTWGANDLLDNT